VVPVEDIDVVMPANSSITLRPRSARDPRYESELEYEGYDTIEEYDNDELNSNVDKQDEDQIRVLDLQDRPEDESNEAEEMFTDKQENRFQR